MPSSTNVPGGVLGQTAQVVAGAAVEETTEEAAEAAPQETAEEANEGPAPGLCTPTDDRPSQDHAQQEALLQVIERGDYEAVMDSRKQYTTL